MLAALRYAGMMPRDVSPEEETRVADYFQLFGQAQTWRNVFNAHWEETSELVLPTSRNTFYYGTFNWPGQKKTDRQVDATGMVALYRFAAILDSLITPRNMLWHSLGADDPYVQKDRPSKLWFEQVRQILFAERYAAMANFSSQNQNNFLQLGAFGNLAMFTDALDPFYGQGLRYCSIPMGELFFLENHQGIVDTVIRWFRRTAEQAERQWPGRLPAVCWPALQQQSQQLFDFIHIVRPNLDRDPERLDFKGMRFESVYVSMQGRCIMQEGGYNSFPYAPSRYLQCPGEMYGRGPAQLVLPALKTLNAEKRTFLKAGHRNADPVLLTTDDGIVDFVDRPGAQNKGGMSSDGKLLVGTLPAGRIDISKEMMDEERQLINDMFLSSLFQILVKTPQMSATEVLERANEKGIILAPTAGRQEVEYLGSLIPRELDLLSQMRKLPPMPPRLKEAQGSFKIVYTSPLAMYAKAQRSVGFMRTLEMAKELVAITQDPAPLDRFNIEAAEIDIASDQGVPESWMADDQTVAKKRQARAQSLAKQQQIQALPAQAAMVKAQSVAQKNSGGAPAQQQGPPAQMAEQQAVGQ